MAAGPDLRARSVPERDAGVASIRVSMIPLAVWGAAVAIAAPSLVGPLRPRFGAGSVLAIATGAALLVAWPRMQRLRWHALLLGAFAAAATWAVALALVDGASGLLGALRHPADAWANVSLVSDPGAFLRRFAGNAATYPTHVAGHPPGLPLLLWAMRGIGLGGPGWAAALMIAAGASATPAVMVAVRALSGETRARSVAPFCALAPAAVWVATSADALFMGVCAWAVALSVLAVVRGSAGLAIAGGATLGIALMLTYGAAPVALIPLAVAWQRRRSLRWRPLAAGASLGVAVVLGAFAAAGFWWPSGLDATRRAYAAGVSRHRGYVFFLIANLGAVGVALGPAFARGVARIRSAAAPALVWGALAAVAAANLSGLSKGEVERIWLPFVPWLLVACSAIEHRPRRWLAAQIVAALTVQSLLRSPW